MEDDAIDGVDDHVECESCVFDSDVDAPVGVVAVNADVAGGVHFELLAQVQTEAQPCTGALNDLPFSWVCDGDARLGPCLEVIAQGKYVWVPFASVRRLVCEAPQELRDLIWLPAKLDIDDSGSLEVFVPARYPGAESDEHRMAPRTDWTELSGDLYIGHSQKCLSTDVDLTGLLDLRSLRIDA